jgi:hypothetical protein
MVNIPSLVSMKIECASASKPRQKRKTNGFLPVARYLGSGHSGRFVLQLSLLVFSAFFLFFLCALLR